MIIGGPVRGYRLPNPNPPLGVDAVLVVEGNKLSGPLPPRLPSRATFVDFHSNALTGTVPAKWANDAPTLNVILLHDNMLKGYEEEINPFPKGPTVPPPLTWVRC